MKYIWLQKPVSICFENHTRTFFLFYIFVGEKSADSRVWPRTYRLPPGSTRDLHNEARSAEFDGVGGRGIKSVL